MSPRPAPQHGKATVGCLAIALALAVASFPAPAGAADPPPTAPAGDYILVRLEQGVQFRAVRVERASQDNLM